MKSKRIKELRRLVAEGNSYPHIIEECLNEIERLQDMLNDEAVKPPKTEIGYKNPYEPGDVCYLWEERLRENPMSFKKDYSEF